ncbi:MAG TPA: sugar transferase [Thermodesulfobacteriota bacterium]|nr:sugar transferase [Thermodesulfobacteriota bacterium]
MTVSKKWLKFPSIAQKHTKAGPLVYAREEFRRILDRERARTDRTGQGFALTIMQVPNSSGNCAGLSMILQALQQRIRFSDVLGWFSDNQLGILLYGANAATARKVTLEIFATLPASLSSLPFQVDAYPSDLPVKSASSSQQQHRSPSSFKASGKKSDVDGRIDNSVLRNHGDNPHSPLPPSAPLMNYLGCPLPIWKRSVDIIGSSCGLLLLSPLFLLVAILIKAVSPGPVFYKQKRIGYLGKPFTFWKFRTMEHGADSHEHKKHMSMLINSEQPMTKLDVRDRKIIPYIGRLLRNSCIDELPQLINVLAGEMTLVGPRPCLPYEYDEYLLWHKRRVCHVPGMTGLWQVNGKNGITFTEMVRTDITYERRRSPWLDFRILLKTISVVAGQLRSQTSLKETMIHETSH